MKPLFLSALTDIDVWLALGGVFVLLWLTEWREG